MELLNSFLGRPIGLSPRSLKAYGGDTHPALTQLSNLIERAPQIMEQRRAIVRQMQIANLTKPLQREGAGKSVGGLDHRTGLILSLIAIP